MRPLLIAAILLFAVTAKAQQVVDLSKSDFKPGDGNASLIVNGMVYSPVKFVKVVAGTPFFREEWMRANLVLEGGTTFTNIPVRLNLLDNEVNYRDASGQEMIASSPIKLIVLIDSITGVKYTFVLGDQLSNAERSLSKTWFRLLVNDKVSLILQMKKSIHETIQYGSATTEQDIPTVEWYYLQMNNNMVRFHWEDWQQLFSDKKDKMAEFIRSNHLKGKTSDDYARLVQYYNQLKNAVGTM